MAMTPIRARACLWGQYYGNGYYFFVTDINGNYYFNQTAEAHEAQVDELKANGLFPG